MEHARRNLREAVELIHAGEHREALRAVESALFYARHQGGSKKFRLACCKAIDALRKVR
jgi:hypothetical protein